MWIDMIPLKLSFPCLYEYCRNKNCLVYDDFLKKFNYFAKLYDRLKISRFGNQPPCATVAVVGHDV
jgi:hypothetical protein